MMHWMPKFDSVGCATPARSTADRRSRLRSRWNGVWLTSLSFGLALMMACSFPRPEGSQLDGGVVGSACVDSSTCSGDLGVCDVNGTKRCVQCVAAADPAESASCAANPDGPVCGAGNVCRKCAAHDECTASEVCAPEGVTDGAMAVAAGTCIDAEKVAYADAIAPATNTTCTKDLPCKTLQAAIDKNLPFVKASGALQGTSAMPSTSVLGKTVTIFFAATGATLSAAETGNPALIIGKGPGIVESNLKVFNLQIIAPSSNGLFIWDRSVVDIVGGKISGASLAGVAIMNARSKTTFTGTEISGNTGEGIAIADGDVTITSSMIKGNGSPGIVISKGKTEIAQSEVSGNTGVGINLVDGELTLSRSTIRANGAGGIAVANNKKFTITNNFIVGNTGNGGVNVGNPSAMSKFEFNTVVDNRDTGSGVANAGGVFCDNAAFDFKHNIIFRNLGGQGGFKQTAGTCTFNNSYIGNQNAEEVDPTVLKFKNDTTDPRDYRLTSASPSGATGVRDVPAAVCTGLTDVDGEARPKAGTCDLGADEY
jgi:Right handed beta helix region